MKKRTVNTRTDKTIVLSTTTNANISLGDNDDGFTVISISNINEKNDNNSNTTIIV